MRFSIPNSVFVPFEWDGSKWVKRNDLPRFKETEEAVQYWTDNPTILFRDGKPVYLQWLECNDWEHIKEFLQGVGKLTFDGTGRVQ